MALRDAQRHAAAADRATGRLRGLTPREREVVARLVDGLGDREIARALGISPRTVHQHLEQSYRKLGLQSRATVVAMMRDAQPAPKAAPPPSAATGASRPAEDRSLLDATFWERAPSSERRRWRTGVPTARRGLTDLTSDAYCWVPNAWPCWPVPTPVRCRSRFSTYCSLWCVLSAIRATRSSMPVAASRSAELT